MVARAHSIKDIEISWNGLDFKEGIAEGQSIQFAKTKSPRSQKDTGTGGIVIVEDPSRSGAVTITVDAESKLHQQLLALAASPALVVLPMLHTNTRTGHVKVLSNAYIQNPPDEAEGTESSTYGWVFGYSKRKDIPGSGIQNVVGS